MIIALPEVFIVFLHLLALLALDLICRNQDLGLGMAIAIGLGFGFRSTRRLGLTFLTFSNFATGGTRARLLGLLTPRAARGSAGIFGRLCCTFLSNTVST